MEEKLFALEEKWVRSEVNRDTYNRWYHNYNSNIISLKDTMERPNKDQGNAFSILQKHLDKLTDLRYIYQKADTYKNRNLCAWCSTAICIIRTASIEHLR